ncbi:MAG: M48 family metalloprotease [Armatimonadetes bacterium]|nr:M48 family metalloprotease [Armatimonadota bacterium]
MHRPGFLKRFITVLFAALALSLCAPSFAAKLESKFGAKEIEYGEEAAAQVAKDNKFSNNADDIKRVQTLGEKLAAVANKMQAVASYGSAKITPFEYKFSIIDDPDINAFSVPGGNIYVNTGLLKFVQSDQELAAVLAHEITHACHHHMIYLLDKQASLNNQMAIALLASMLSGANSSDLNNVLMGVQLIQIAKINGYGQEAERDADHGAIVYMKEAGFNPVGMLTFLERLSLKPELVELGIYRSHPMHADRVRAAKALLGELKIPINRRATTDAIKAEVRNNMLNGADAPAIYLQEKLVYYPAPLADKTAAQRAQNAADIINAALDSGLQMRELTSEPAAGIIIARNKPLITIIEADAKLMGKSLPDLTKSVTTAIRNVLWKQMVDTVQ